MIVAALLALGPWLPDARAERGDPELIELARPHPGQVELEAAFKQAADDYGVPVEILRAVAFIESRWVHTGPTIDRGYGLMHLVDNGVASTLIEAVEVSGYSVEELMTDPIANLRGGAALLAHYTDSTARAARVIGGLLGRAAAAHRSV